MVSRQHRGSSVKHAGQFLPNGLHKSEIPDYLLSKSFEKRAGVWLPRREVLLASRQQQPMLQCLYGQPRRYLAHNLARR